MRSSLPVVMQSQGQSEDLVHMDRVSQELRAFVRDVTNQSPAVLIRFVNTHAIATRWAAYDRL